MEKVDEICEVCEDIKEDWKNIEEDTKKINCFAICDLIKHCLKCIFDSLRCCFKLKMS